MQRRKEVTLSGFIELDMDGEVIFYPTMPCPRCDGWIGGEDAGAFECPICGYSECEKFSDSHGYSLIVEGTWKLLRRLLPSKRLRWETSYLLYGMYEKLRDKWWQFKKRITYSEKGYIWSGEEQKWRRYDL